MDPIIVKFRTRQPVPFKEHCSDAEFSATVSGSATIVFNSLPGEDGKTDESTLRELIIGMIPGCFKCWPEGKLIMGPGNREILEELLSVSLKGVGMEAKIYVNSVGLAEGQMDKYMSECGEALKEQMNPQVSAKDLEAEKHGPLICFSLNYFSHGMMAGSSSSSGDELEWNKDGTVTLTSSHNGGGRNTRFKYSVKPEIAQKMRDYVRENNLARLSKEDIRTPVMFDNFTSASFSMTFDDSSVGGSPCERCYVHCGPAGMSFRSIETALGKILDECRETGECILHEVTETGGGFMGLGGFMNAGSFPGMMMQPQGVSVPGSAPGPASSPAAAAADPPSATGDTWTCTCGQKNNTGKFCPNCGNPSPAYLAELEKNKQ